MHASARRSRSDRERLPGNDAAKHRRSIRTISSAIAGWLLGKIRLGSRYGAGGSPNKSDKAQTDVRPMSAFGPKRTWVKAPGLAGRLRRLRLRARQFALLAMRTKAASSRLKRSASS